MTTTDLPGVIATDSWQPGDQLYERHSYSQYLFNFRDDPTSEDCNCGDAASWPREPLLTRRIPDDPWENFLAWHRSLREAGNTAEDFLLWIGCLLSASLFIVVLAVAR